MQNLRKAASVLDLQYTFSYEHTYLDLYEKRSTRLNND